MACLLRAFICTRLCACAQRSHAAAAAAGADCYCAARRAGGGRRMHAQYDVDMSAITDVKQLFSTIPRHVSEQVPPRWLAVVRDHKCCVRETQCFFLLSKAQQQQQHLGGSA
jgi:hypothetical protein